MLFSGNIGKYSVVTIALLLSVINLSAKNKWHLTEKFDVDIPSYAQHHAEQESEKNATLP